MQPRYARQRRRVEVLERRQSVCRDRTVAGDGARRSRRRTHRRERSEETSANQESAQITCPAREDRRVNGTTLVRSRRDGTCWNGGSREGLETERAGDRGRTDGGVRASDWTFSKNLNVLKVPLYFIKPWTLISLVSKNEDRYTKSVFALLLLLLLTETDH